MAVIGKIRRRAGLLIGIVGFSLVAFILGDLLTTNRSFLKGTGNEVAVIGGNKISIQDFESRVTQMEDNYKINTGNENVDQSTLESLREQAWNQMLNEEILGKQVTKTGVNVSADELFDMIQGKNPHPQIKEAFKDPKTGQFSPANVINFLKNMDNDATGKTRAQWVAFEKYIREDRVKEKYNDMIKFGLFATTEEAKRMYDSQNHMASIRFVDMNYASVADSTIPVDDKEMRDYYNAHQNDYKQEASRKLEFVTFEVIPSAEDRENTKKEIEKLVTPFHETTDDSLFVSVNGDSKTKVSFFKRGTLSPAIDSVFFNGAEKGTVVGPYEENNFYKLSKLVDLKTISDSIKVSHALIAFKGAERAPAEVSRTKEEAKAMADSLFAIIKKDPKRFDDIAKNGSDDKVAAEKNGDLEWITRDSPMDPKFKDGAFETSTGNFNLVESPFGFHIIKVTEQTKPQLQAEVATLDRRIEAGSKTYQAAFNKASTFAAKNNTGDAFDKAVKEDGLNKRVADNLKEGDKTIAGIDNPRSLIQWAYKATKDDVSKSFEFGNKFVVAHLVEVKEKGIAPMEQVADLVKGKVVTEKKGKMFSEKLEAQMAKSKTIEELAAGLGLQVKTADNVNFASSFIPNLGVEPDLVGTIFTMKAGQLSKPIVGASGVFVAIVDKFTEPAPTKDYTNNKKQLEQQLQQRTSYEVFNALKEKANVVDNRGKYY